MGRTVRVAVLPWCSRICYGPRVALRHCCLHPVLNITLRYAMRPGGGKQKGASFEREVCVALSKWVTGGKSEDVFWRSAMSGGRATVGHRKGKNHASQVGDISCIHPAGHYFISHFAPECKHYADLDYQGLLTGKGKLLAFWEEINTQAERYDKHPFLVARQNRMKPTVCLDKVGRDRLGLLEREALLYSPRYDMYILDFEHFLKACKPYVKVEQQRKIRIRLNQV